MRPALFLAAIVFVVSACMAKDPLSQWASEGTMFVDAEGQIITSRSPNGEYALQYDKGGLTTISGAMRERIEPANSLPAVTEVVWREDSKAFILNGSDGGSVGTWGALMFHKGQSGRWLATDFNQVVAPYLTTFLRCGPDDAVNIGAVGWVNGGDQILLVAQIPSHSSCRNMGELRGFLLRSDDLSIVRQVGEAELRRDWRRYLGKRLQKSG